MAFYPDGELWPVQVRILAAQLERRALAQGLAERIAPQPKAQHSSTPSAAASAPREPLRVRLWRRIYWLWLLATWRPAGGVP